MNVRVKTTRKTGRNKKKKTHSREKFFGTSVDYEIKNIQETAVWKDVLIPESSWCFPREKGYQAALKRVYTNYSRATDEAEALKEHITTNFSSEEQQDKFVQSVIDTLDSNLSQPTSVMSL